MVAQYRLDLDGPHVLVPTDLDDPALYTMVPDVPVFGEHETTVRDGRKLTFGRRELIAIAQRCNRRIKETGDYAAVIVGHTSDPTEENPSEERPVVAFAGPFRAERGPDSKWQIRADFHFYKGQEETLRRFPRRSAELWLEDQFEDMVLDPICLLGGDRPRLDLGLLYSASRHGRLVERYAAGPSALSVAPRGEVEIRKYTASQSQGDSVMALSPEDVQQIVAALAEAKPWIADIQAAVAAAAKQDEAQDEAAAKTPGPGDQPPTATPVEKPEKYEKEEEEKKPPEVPEAKKEEKEEYANKCRYSKLEAEVASLRGKLVEETHKRVNAERYSKLCGLRGELEFDLEAEKAFCVAPEMSDAQFERYSKRLQVNCQPAAMGGIPEVVLSHASTHDSADPKAKERYSKEHSDKARKMCEEALKRGKSISYNEALESVQSGKTL